MGNRVATSLSAVFLFAAFAALLFNPSPAAAARGSSDDGFRSSLTSGIKEMITERFCRRWEAMQSRLPHLHDHHKCNEEPPPPDEPTVDISADPMTITSGGSSELEWNSENADSCSASDGWSGDKSTHGTETVSPGTTTTYTITCTGGGGTANDSVTVTVTEPEPETATLTLVKVVTNDDSGTADADDWTLSASGPTNISGVSGSSTVTNVVVDVGTYTLSESGGPAGYTASEYSCIKNGGAAVPGNSIALADGDIATCTITNDDNEPATGTLIVRKVVIRDDGGSAATTTFSFQVNGGTTTPFEADGENSMTVSVGTYSVTEPAVTGWTTTLSSSCTNETVSEGETETCTITNNDIADEPDEPTVSITASRTTIFEGSVNDATTTLAWDSTNASSCVASDAWSGSKAVDGEETVTPTATSTYVIECAGAGGTTTDSVIVNFVPEEEPAPAGNLLITEVHYDLATTSQGVESANEWVELHNGTNQTLNLAGYSIGDSAGVDIFPEGTTLEAGQFMVITSTTTTASFYSIPAGAVILVLPNNIGSNGLGNAGDRVSILNAASSTVDAVSWGTDTFAFTPSVRPGATADDFSGQPIGRIDINVDTGSAADWETKVTPTPGQ